MCFVYKIDSNKSKILLLNLEFYYLHVMLIFLHSLLYEYYHVSKNPILL